MDLAKDEFNWLLAEETLIGLPMLIIANKMDLPKAMSIDDIAEKLDTTAISTGNNKRHFKLVAGSALNDMKDINRGIDWLQAEMIDNSFVQVVKAQDATNTSQNNGNKAIHTEKKNPSSQKIFNTDEKYIASLSQEIMAAS